MRWYFLSDQQEPIPTSAEQLPALAFQGVIRPQTLVWFEGQADWKSIGEIKPELFSAGPVLRSAGVVSNAIRVAANRPTDALVRYSVWMIATGVMIQLAAILGILGTVAEGVRLLKEWKTATDSLEGIAPPVGLPRILLISGAQLLVAGLIVWTGVLLILGAGGIRRAHLLGDPFLMEVGLKKLGRVFFFAVMILLLLVIIGVTMTAIEKYFPPNPVV